MVGESGSGKSTLAKCIARLVDADDGKIFILGEDFLRAKGESLTEVSEKCSARFSRSL